MTHRRKQYKAALLTAAWLVGMVAVCPGQQPFSYKYTVDDGLVYPEAFISFANDGMAWVFYSSTDFISRFDGVNFEHINLTQLGLPSGIILQSSDQYGSWFQREAENGQWVIRRTPDGQWKKYLIEGDILSLTQGYGYGIHLMDKQAYQYQYDPATDRYTRSKKPLYPVGSIPGEKLYGYFFNGEEIYLVFEYGKKGQLLTRYGENYQRVIRQPGRGFIATYLRGDDFRGIFFENGQYRFYQRGTSKPISVNLPNGRKGLVMKPIALTNFQNGQATPYGQFGILSKDPVDGTLSAWHVDSIGNTHLLLDGLAQDMANPGLTFGPDGYWWHNASSGIVRTNPALLTFSSSAPNMVQGLHAINEDAEGRIWMGGYNGEGGFSIYNGKTLERKTIGNSAPVLPGTWRSPDGTLFFFIEQPFNGLAAIMDGKPTPVMANGNRVGQGFYMQPLKSGQLALGLYDKGLGLATVEGTYFTQFRTIGKEKGMSLVNVLTIAEDRAGRLWAGRTSQGIAIYDPQRDTATTWARSAEQPKSLGAISSCLADDGSLLLGTNLGLRRLPEPHRFDYLHDNVFDFLEKIPLPGYDSSTVLFLKNLSDYLVVGSQLGVYFFDKKYKGQRPRIFTLRYGSDIAGGGSEQNAVLYTPPLGGKGGGYLWVGTQKGATRIDLAALRFDTSATTLRLTSFTAGGSAVSFENGAIERLPPKKRNINFSFLPSGNTLLKDDHYFDIAVVSGQGDTLFWRSQTKERGGEMPYLPKGEYTLHITAYKHNVVSGQAAWVFAVPGLLSENPWFWVGLALLVLGIPFTFFYLKKRHQAELEKSRRERDALQIRALSNFFNPHFINNALHWVQSRYRKDPDTATIIGRLSENVDLLFANTQSGKAYHPLAKELNIVKNYLKIQQVRFGEGLRVSLDLPPGDGEMDGVAVPSMLLQIHAENAVEKGIRNRKGVGHFLLSVKMGGDGCHITIEDDGRGRPTGSGFVTTERKGSTAVMDDLIALFNRYSREPITVRYEDFVFEEKTGEQHGTRVHFFIPKKYDYELS